DEVTQRCWTKRSSVRSPPQLMSGTKVTVAGHPQTIRRTSTQRLRTVAFTVEGRQYQAIEQNPEKPSRWGQLARSGHQVVQFKDVEINRFVAVAVDGKVRLYRDKTG